MAYTDIIVERKERAAWITLNKPAVKNAMGRQTLADLLSAFDEIRQEPLVAVTVIEGAGRNFCTGMDLREIPGPTGPGAEEFTRLADQVFLGIEKFNKVTVAVIRGYCLAGGLEIALGCDFVLAEENSRIGDGHINLPGFVPNGGASIRLPRLLGTRKAKELLLTGDIISGKEAERLGLVNTALPAEKLDTAVSALVAKLCEKSPLGLEYMKKLINASGECSLETGLLMERSTVKHLRATADCAEAEAARRDKRKPKFTGK